MKILDVPQSGSLAGQTSSRNRFGQYRRTRAVPVNPSSSAQNEVRGRLADQSTAWRYLTDNQRNGWANLGAAMVRTDSLGQTYTLTGFQAFVSVNSTLAACSEATIEDAPSFLPPQAPASVTLTATTAALSVAFTPTPLGEDVHALISVSPQRSAGRTYEADYRLLTVTAAAGTSPQNILTAYTAKFGAPVEGNKIFVSVQFALGGILSAPLIAAAVVTAAA